jgi:DNA-binding transcriptional regulator PaaX
MDSFANKILSDLYDCIDYGFSYRAKKGLFILDMFPNDWRSYDKKKIQESVKDLAKSRFVERKKLSSGEIMAVLTIRGRIRALNLRFNNVCKQKGDWDKKWRMVAFDFPERFKKERNAFRYRLKIAGFYKLQESMFVCPYDCKDLVNRYLDLLHINKFVRFAVLDYIDNWEELVRKFKL